MTAYLTRALDPLAAARNYTPWTEGIFSNMGDYHRLVMDAHRAKNIGNIIDDSATHPPVLRLVHCLCVGILATCSPKRCRQR